MSADGEYLSSLYPKEMLDLAQQFGEHAFGFDWLGDDVAGRPVSAAAWLFTTLKPLEREFNQDPAYQDATIEAIDRRRVEIIESATAQSLNDGRYDVLTSAEYALLRDEAAGSKYAPVVEFYSERDRMIARNAAKAIRLHPGTTIVLVTGADHRGFLIEALQRDFGDSIGIVAAPPIERP
jgi:hypothetical protein